MFKDTLNSHFSETKRQRVEVADIANDLLFPVCDYRVKIRTQYCCGRGIHHDQWTRQLACRISNRLKTCHDPGNICRRKDEGRKRIPSTDTFIQIIKAKLPV